MSSEFELHVGFPAVTELLLLTSWHSAPEAEFYQAMQSWTYVWEHNCFFSIINELYTVYFGNTAHDDPEAQEIHKTEGITEVTS